MTGALDAMVKAALRAGDILVEARRTGPAWIQEKGLNDFVTAADKASEVAIQETLHAAFPDIPLLAEEGSGSASGREGRFWCVDPLDGTNNFVHQIPVYCVSVGLIEGGRPVLGAVYDPVHAELFTGGDGSPATLNGFPIRTSGRTDPAGAFVATGFPFKEMDHLESYAEGFKRVAPATGGIRRCGAAAMDLVWTACGRFDGFWERGLWPWDVAAGAAILRAAGGACTAYDGTDGFLFGRTVVAGATPAFAEALRMLVGTPGATT
jgi:myo-inositol-1(or 4)-monophosphatase